MPPFDPDEFESSAAPPSEPEPRSAPTGPPPPGAEPHRPRPRPVPPVLPHDLEAERAILATVLMDDGRYDEVDLAPADWYSDRHRTIWDAITAVHQRGKPVDLVTVHGELRETGRIDGAGGHVYLADVLDVASRAVNLSHYVDLVRYAALRRQVIHDAASLAAAAQTEPDPAELARLTESVTARWSDARPRRESITRTDLYAPHVAPEYPEWIVRNFLPRKGLSMLWAQPGAGKTYALLSLVHQLVGSPSARALWANPSLPVEANLRKVLWVSAEDRTGGVRARADRVRRGLADPEIPAGAVRHIYARDPRRRVFLDDVRELLEHEDPVDLVILDSLTGLRPREIVGPDGRPRTVKWDVDNDATSILSDLLIDLIERYSTSILIVHHTGRDLKRSESGPGYRGPTEWWATVHAMWGLVPDPLSGPGVIKVQVDKMRDGRMLNPFRILVEHDRYETRMGWIGEVEQGRSDSADKILAYLRGAGMASQAEIAAATDITRKTVRAVLGELVAEGLVYDTGNRGAKGSPVYAIRPPDPTSTPSRSDDQDTHNSEVIL